MKFFFCLHCSVDAKKKFFFLFDFFKISQIFLEKEKLFLLNSNLFLETFVPAK